MRTDPDPAESSCPVSVSKKCQSGESQAVSPRLVKCTVQNVDWLFGNEISLYSLGDFDSETYSVVGMEAPFKVVDSESFTLSLL